MPTEQSAQSHAATDPVVHYVLLPFFVASFVASIVLAVRAWPQERFLHLWIVAMALALLAMCIKLRLYGVANQDRIIRLEERVRIATLVPAADAGKLSTPQLIALRFASDAELPALVDRTLAENLAPKAIKQSIAVWRPDYHRI